MRDKDDDITRILQKYFLPDGFENRFVELNLFLNKKDFHAKFCQILENLNTNSSQRFDQIWKMLQNCFVRNMQHIELKVKSNSKTKSKQNS